MPWCAARNLGEFLEQLEAKRGVAGYRAVQAKLEAASEQASGVDQSKEAALADISALVRRMADTLKERKACMAFVWVCSLGI